MKNQLPKDVKWVKLEELCEAPVHLIFETHSFQHSKNEVSDRKEAVIKN